jgi:hypothetical protein
MWLLRKKGRGGGGEENNKEIGLAPRSFAIMIVGPATFTACCFTTMGLFSNKPVCTVVLNP